MTWGPRGQIHSTKPHYYGRCLPLVPMKCNALWNGYEASQVWLLMIRKWCLAPLTFLPIHTIGHAAQEGPQVESSVQAKTTYQGGIASMAIVSICHCQMHSLRLHGKGPNSSPCHAGEWKVYHWCMHPTTAPAPSLEDAAMPPLIPNMWTCTRPPTTTPRLLTPAPTQCHHSTTTPDGAGLGNGDGDPAQRRDRLPSHQHEGASLPWV